MHIARITFTNGLSLEIAASTSAELASAAAAVLDPDTKSRIASVQYVIETQTEGRQPGDTVH